MLLVPGRPGGPSFTGGETITLSDLKGKVVLLNFWATWCAPYKEKIPRFNEAYVLYKDNGLYILGFPIERGENLVRRFIEKREINYLLAMVTPQLNKNYQSGNVVPVTFVIDKKGKMRQKHIGNLDKEILEKYIPELLEED
jgi:peroxiredoxin